MATAKAQFKNVWRAACIVAPSALCAAAVPLSISRAADTTTLPAITLEPETPSFGPHVTDKCGWFDKLWLPAAACQRNFVAFLHSDQPIPEATVKIIGIGPDAIGFDGDGLLRANVDTNDLNLKLIDESKLTPGEYKGRLLVTFADVTTILQVPFDIYVKARPLIAFLFILVGVLLGQLVRFMANRGDKQGVQRRTFDRLSSRMQQLLTVDQEALGPLVKAADAAIDDPNATDADKKVADLRNAIDLLTELEEILEITPDDARADIVRTDVRLKDLASAGQELQAMKQDIEKDERPAPAVVPLVEEAFIARVAKTNPQLRIASASAWMVRFWNDVAVPYVIPVMLYIVLICILLATGMQTLYVNGSATLGANAIVDYLALLTWGLSADIASRSLSSLTAAKPKSTASTTA